MLALGRIHFSYEKGREWLREFLLLDVSKNIIRKETERIGQLQAEIEGEWIDLSQDKAWLQEQKRQPQASSDLYCAINMAKARTEPRGVPKQRMKTGEISRHGYGLRPRKCLLPG